MVMRPAERRGADKGEVCFTSAGAYRGMLVGDMLVFGQGVSVSESDEGMHRCKRCVAGVTGTGCEAGVTGTGRVAGVTGKG